MVVTAAVGIFLVAVAVAVAVAAMAVWGFLAAVAAAAAAAAAALGIQAAAPAPPPSPTTHLSAHWRRHHLPFVLYYVVCCTHTYTHMCPRTQPPTHAHTLGFPRTLATNPQGSWVAAKVLLRNGCRPRLVGRSCVKVWCLPDVCSFIVAVHLYLSRNFEPRCTVALLHCCT